MLTNQPSSTEKTVMSFIRKPEEFASVALMRAGFAPTSPLIPSTAFKFEVLELYRLLSKHHRRLGLQPFLRSLYEFHGSVHPHINSVKLSRAYDCYLAAIRGVEAKVQQVLGRTEENARLMRTCPPCLYFLEGEDGLLYDILMEADGNMSLKRFKKAGRSDGAKFHSDYMLTKEVVDTFADVAQVRKKPRKTTKNRDGEVQGEGTQEDADALDAQLETGVIGEDQSNATVDHERGDFPMEVDPLADTFGGLLSHCAEHWKANVDDDKKVMWDCFEECGEFILLCRHGHVLMACDMIRSGEQ
jgi:hypothetical protein